jgi:hypothetical protein
MLNFKEIQSFWREVTVMIPSGKLAHKAVKFQAEFAQLTRDELAEIREEEEGANILDKVLLSVKDVQTENNEDPLEMCKSSLLVSNAIVKTYMKELAGDEGRKNSKK